MVRRAGRRRIWRTASRDLTRFVPPRVLCAAQADDDDYERRRLEREARRAARRNMLAGVGGDSVRLGGVITRRMCRPAD